MITHRIQLDAEEVQSSQMRLRITAEFSPMPPAKTNVSRPPSPAARAPVAFLAW